MARSALPQLIDGILQLPTADIAEPLRVGSPAWFSWLADPANRAFSVPTAFGALTVRREPKGGSAYWYAYYRNGPRLRKAYLGQAADLSQARLDQALARLSTPAAPVTQTDPIELRLLGAPLLLRGITTIALSSAKALVLLGYLALAEGPQRRERLLDLFWPESLPAAARKNLRNTLWAIRTTLGDAVLITSGERIGLAQGIRVDLQSFRAAVEHLPQVAPTELQQALECYRGPLLDGISLHEAPDAELWLAHERERLLQGYNAAVAVRLEQQRKAEAWSDLAQTATQALIHDELHEAAHRALMETLARQGNRAGALRQYEQLRTTLDRELGVPPDPASEAIHDAIVRGALTPTAPVRPPRPAPRRPTPLVRQPFIGRTAEQQVLDAEWAKAAHETRVVILSGELGIGKSRLWHHWAARLESPHLIEISCLEATRSMPFAPLIAVFSNTVWSARVAAVDATMPLWLQELTRLRPSLQDLSPHPRIGGAPAEDRQRSFEAFVQALLAGTAPPHLLFVDDLHWADTATLDWLDYAMHRLHATPLLLVVSYRTEDTSRELLRRIAQWERNRPVRRIALSRLTPGEASALLSALNTHTSAQARLVHESAGNPYFLIELARADDPRNVPPALHDLVRARIDALPEPAQQVLQAAAILEPDIEGSTLVQISALAEELTLAALDTLFASGMLSEHDERYSFSHPLIATVVRAATSRVRRAVLHRRAATALAQIYANHLPAQAGRIAEHYREAADRPQAAAFATLAGDYALSVAAVDAAVQFYQQALASEPNAERTLRLGRARAWHGDQAAAHSLLQQAYADFDAQGDHANMALTSLVLADLALAHGGYAEAGQLAQHARDLIGPNEPFVAANAHILIGTAARARGDVAAAQRHIDQCIRIAEQHQLREVQMYAAIGQSNLRAEQGDLTGAYAAALQMITLAQQIGNGLYEVLGRNSAAYRATMLGNYAAAHTHIHAGLSIAEARALELPRQWLYSTRGELALAEGAWAEAQQWLERARAEAVRQNNPSQVAMIDANLGRAAAGHGNLDRAVELMSQAWQASATSAVQYQYVQIGLWLAAMLIQQGAYAQAQATWETTTAQLSPGAATPLHTEAEQVRRQIEQAAL